MRNGFFFKMAAGVWLPLAVAAAIAAAGAAAFGPARKKRRK